MNFSYIYLKSGRTLEATAGLLARVVGVPFDRVKMLGGEGELEFVAMRRNRRLALHTNRRTDQAKYAPFDFVLELDGDDIPRRRQVREVFEKLFALGIPLALVDGSRILDRHEPGPNTDPSNTEDRTATGLGSTRAKGAVAKVTQRAQVSHLAAQERHAITRT